MGACCSTYEEFGDPIPLEERKHLLSQPRGRGRGRDSWERNSFDRDRRDSFDRDRRDWDRGSFDRNRKDSFDRRDSFDGDRRDSFDRRDSWDRDSFDTDRRDSFDRDRRGNGDRDKNSIEMDRYSRNRDDKNNQESKRNGRSPRSPPSQDRGRKGSMIDPRWKPKGGEGYDDDYSDSSSFDYRSDEESEEDRRDNRDRRDEEERKSEEQRRRLTESEEEERRKRMEAKKKEQQQRRRYIRSVVLAQACVRRWRARRRFLVLRKAAVVIQTHARIRQAKKELRRRQKQRERKIILAQAVMRGWYVRVQYRKQRQAAVLIQSVYRATEERKLFKKMEEKAIKRYHVGQEILQTEESYYDILCIIIDHFRDPLLEIVNNEAEQSGEKKPRSKENVSGENKWITKELIKAIFSDISLIAEIHRELSQELHEVITAWHPHGSCIGGIFLSMLDSMKLYTGYVNNYDKAIKTLGECMTNPQFSSFVQKAEREASTREKIIDLPSLLINPVQRIPRYEMLLKDFLKNTPPDHKDYEDIEKALAKVQDVAKYINEHKRSVENLERMKDIKDQLKGLRSKRIKKYLQAPDIILLKEGKATRIDGKSEKKDYLFLFNKMLVMGQEKKKKRFHSISTRYHHNENIKLKHTTVEEEEGNAWSLTTAAGKKYVWRMPTKKDRNEWLTLLKELQQKRNSKHSA